MKCGVIYWTRGDGLSIAFSDAMAGQGVTAVPFMWNEPLPAGLDAVFAFGPLGSLVPLVHQLASYPKGTRPRLAFFQTEQFANPQLPEPVRFLCGWAKSRLDRFAYRRDGGGTYRSLPLLAPFAARANRLRYYGDLFWMRSVGVLDVLATTSRWTATRLRQVGFDPMVVDFGFAPEWGAELGLERDIPVLWIGKAGTRRRARILARVRADLRAAGVEMMMVDGVERPYVFGAERTRLLNRTQIVLNILREPWDDNSMRFFLAAPNRALIVSETTLPHTSFEAGVHLVAAPVERLAATLLRYLADKAERERIAENAFALVSRMTMSTTVGSILDRLSPETIAAAASGDNE